MAKPARVQATTKLLLGSAISLLTFVAACQYVIGLDDPMNDPRPPDAHVDAPVVTGVDADPCNHAFPPPAPTIDNAPLVVKGPFFLAIRETRLLQRFGYDAGAYGGGGGDSGFPTPGAAFGLDLDNACTCEKDRHQGAPSCVSPDQAGTVCDGDGGIDNALGTALTDLQVFGNVDDLATINKRIMRGDSSVLLTLTNYNGEANDKDVQATLALVTRPLETPADAGGCQDAGLRLPSDDGGELDGGDQQFAPTWDGCDVWQTVEQGPQFHGYVVDHQLVVESDLESNVPVGAATVRVTYPVAVGTLIPDGNGGFTLEDGIFAGRAAQDALFAAIMTFKVSLTPGNDISACLQPAVVDLFRSRFCPGLDIMSSPAADFGPDGGYICDSVSFTFAYRSQKALLSTNVVSFPSEDCAEAGVKLTCFVDGGADAGF